MTGASRSSGGARPRPAVSTSAATSDAVTADVAPSGPATAKGRELRKAMMAAQTAIDMNVAVTPLASQGWSGGAKMRLAKDSP